MHSFYNQKRFEYTNVANGKSRSKNRDVNPLKLKRDAKNAKVFWLRFSH
jgi:hypothetical protein